MITELYSWNEDVMYIIMRTEELSNFSRNYQVIKTQVLAEGFDGLEAMTETYRRLKSCNKALEDLRPVNKEEALTLFSDYYKTKYSKTPEDGVENKKLDFQRRRKNALKPGSVDSYLYRPTDSRISGPELYDMVGVDDHPISRIGEGSDVMGRR